ncbi:MAG: potassium-transporting ATPase subunit KdpA, partial [Proteobacteria bacterium]|nr:potassium-transporting ATPase subunit KdpA [Pseudomonadota bacterium]
MSNHAWLLLGLYLLILLLAAKPLGSYIANVMEGRATLVLRLGGGIESVLYRLCGIRKGEEMDWLQYALAILLFNVLGALTVYVLQRLQLWLPLNPQNFANVSPDSSFNTAISFATNTNWQGYSGESTMSYLTQMLGLTVQNFFSAATGIVVVIALIRGFARHTAKTVGNVWVDLTRITLYVLLPISLVYAVILVSQCAIQNFDAYKDVTTLEVTKYDNPKLDAAGQPFKDDKGVAITEPATTPTQALPMGPVASQEAIKMLGTNGGGFFNANSAHPYENPTPLSNFIQMLSIFLIPAALCLTFGQMVGDTRQGWAVLAAMTLMFVVMAIAAMSFEQQGNPLLGKLGVDMSAGNLEGKEARFGIAESGLFATITTLASCGAVNAMHDSFTPLGGFVPLWNMMLGEVVFGGVGAGLYGMLVFAVMAVFIAGLMIGRTPEYLGKKIESFEIKMVSIASLV